MSLRPDGLWRLAVRTGLAGSHRSSRHRKTITGRSKITRPRRVAKTASNGKRSVSSLLKGRRFFKKVAHESIVERKEEEGESGSIANVDGESDDDDAAREDSILMGPGSPSFRVYCDYSPSLADAGDEEITKSNASLSYSQKESITQSTRKRRARRIIRNTLRSGGSTGVKKLLPASTRSTSHEQPMHAIVRPTR